MKVQYELCIERKLQASNQDATHHAIGVGKPDAHRRTHCIHWWPHALSTVEPFKRSNDRMAPTAHLGSNRTHNFRWYSRPGRFLLSNTNRDAKVLYACLWAPTLGIVVGACMAQYLLDTVRWFRNNLRPLPFAPAGAPLQQ